MPSRFPTIAAAVYSSAAGNSHASTAALAILEDRLQAGERTAVLAASPPARAEQRFEQAVARRDGRALDRDLDARHVVCGGLERVEIIERTRLIAARPAAIIRRGTSTSMKDTPIQEKRFSGGDVEGGAGAAADRILAREVPLGQEVIRNSAWSAMSAR